MRISVNLGRIDQEEELSTDIVCIIQDQSVFLHKGALIAETSELERSRVKVASLLCPYRLKVHRANLTLGLKAKVTGRKPFSQKT